MTRADEAEVTRARPDVPTVPESLLRELAFSLGEEEAGRWLAGAREVARDLMARWRLRPLEVLAGGSMSLCLLCESEEGTATVLKVPANPAGGAVERAALRTWDGAGAATLLDEDEATSAMLMRFLGRVGVGSYGLAEIVDLADRLHAAVPAYPFAPVETNLAHRIAVATQRFADSGDTGAGQDLALAVSLLSGLLRVEGPRVLLHGDLQAKNLIVDGDRLTAVDPLPVIGPAEFDVAFWIARSVHASPTVTYVDQVVAMRPRVHRERLLAWTWALAVIENRPYLAAGREQREQFIETFRPA